MGKPSIMLFWATQNQRIVAKPTNLMVWSLPEKLHMLLIGILLTSRCTRSSILQFTKNHIVNVLPYAHFLRWSHTRAICRKFSLDFDSEIDIINNFLGTYERLGLWFDFTHSLSWSGSVELLLRTLLYFLLCLTTMFMFILLFSLYESLNCILEFIVVPLVDIITAIFLHLFTVHLEGQVIIASINYFGLEKLYLFLSELVITLLHVE